LKKKEIDISASAFALTQSRSEVVDYLPTLMESYQQIFIRNPSESLDWTAYLKPLSSLAWISVGMFVLLTPIIVVALFYDCKFSLEFYIVYTEPHKNYT
jgi:hypothetical protein